MNNSRVGKTNALITCPPSTVPLDDATDTCVLTTGCSLTSEMLQIIETSTTCCSIGISLNSFLVSSNQATVAWLNEQMAVKLAEVTLFCLAKSVRPDMTSSPLARMIT